MSLGLPLTVYLPHHNPYRIRCPKIKKFEIGLLDQKIGTIKIGHMKIKTSETSRLQNPETDWKGYFKKIRGPETKDLLTIGFRAIY